MTKTHVSGLFMLTVLLAIAAVSGVAQGQTFSPLYDFNPSAGDSAYPVPPGTQIQGQDGNIYSTSPNGGTIVQSGSEEGTVFDMTPAGALSVLFTFYGSLSGFNNTGAIPTSGLTLGTDGNFYGSANQYGAFGFGNVFVITPGGALTDLHDFTGGSDGGFPYSAPIEGRDGNYYGTTSCGGDQSCSNNGGNGTIYKITPSGTLTTLYTFDEVHGAANYAPLILGSDGNFYGTGWGGVGSTSGVVYKITPSGSYTVLHYFCLKMGCPDGSFPYAALVQGSDGNFYGTANNAFKITPTGKLTVLYSNLVQPLAGLVQATDGNFYGVTYAGGTSGSGSIFSVSPKKPYTYSLLYSFDGITASLPGVTLLQHTNGTLYGLSLEGGTYNSGVFYSFDMGLKPFVSVTTLSGAVGSPVGILGQGFTGTKKVMFTGAAANFTVISDTYLTATVPSGAKTGFVSVKTPGGTLKSNKKFQVTP